MIFIKNILAIVFSFYAGIIFSQPLPVVAAAADLKFALEEIAKNYKKENNKDIQLVFGSSGLLWQQIKNGAPFSLYLSADESYVDDLAKNGLTVDAGTLYAIGRIVLLAKKDSPLVLRADKEAFIKMMASAKRIAIANPEHAPYGKAAKEYLISLGLWKDIEAKLVFGENISQTTMYALSGNADLAISALSLATAPNIQRHSKSELIPDSLHKPLRQKMVLIKNNAPSANEFYRYLQQPESKKILSRYGFMIPQY